jgi:hypothetical protein
MENEKEFSPEESLKLISQVIADTRKNFHSLGYFLLLWGWVSVIILVVNFFIIQYPNQFDQRNLCFWTVWFPIAFAIAISLIYLRRKNRTGRAKNKFAMIIRTLWVATFITLILSIIIAHKLGFNPASITLLIIGPPAFITGYIIKFKPLMFGATLFGIFSLITVFIPANYQLLVEAFAIALGYLVPGYMFKFNKK